MALGAAYAAIDKSFKEYRGRVIERFGEQVDTELKYGIKAKKFEEIEVDPETGKEKKVKKTVMVADPNLQSDYAVYFDSKSRNYETNPDYNRMFLKAQQAFANDKLQTRGHLFLNEVLDDLDLPRTPAGQIVGWTKDGRMAMLISASLRWSARLRMVVMSRRFCSTSMLRAISGKKM